MAQMQVTETGVVITVPFGEFPAIRDGMRWTNKRTGEEVQAASNSILTLKGLGLREIAVRRVAVPLGDGVADIKLQRLQLKMLNFRSPEEVAEREEAQTHKRQNTARKNAIRALFTAGDLDTARTVAEAADLEEYYLELEAAQENQ